LSKKKKVWEKRILFFSSHFAQKRGSRLGVQATEARRVEIRAPRLLGGQKRLMKKYQRFNGNIPGKNIFIQYCEDEEEY